MRSKRLLLVTGAALAVLVVGLLLAPFFLPKDEVVLNEDASGEVVVHRSGAWVDGDRAHQADGRIEVVTVDGAPHVRLVDFDMTAGPDVYLYLTQSSSPRSTQDVEQDGVRIRVVTPQDSDARLNERGTFLVPLSMSLDDALAYGGAAAWCDDFNVLFGSAALA